MQQYTPGPWEAELITDRKRGREVGQHWSIYAPRHIGHKVAQVHTDEMPMRGGAEYEVAAADARLIAAAPDLLEACEALMTWLDFDGDAIEEHGLYEKAEALARAAIAKARGEDAQ